jgi:catechol 2,3-dioxygenase-like lactoylglutathione lyase family enzyme
MKVNGIAHIVITVNSIEKSLEFYQGLFEFLELRMVHRNEKGAYFVGGKTAVGLMQSDPAYQGQAFLQTRVGLHHFCFRAYAREDVDRLHEFLKKKKAKIIRPAEEGSWAPGYYSVLFEDPDGIRLEMSFVPDKGVLAPGQKFNPAGYEDEQ